MKQKIIYLTHWRIPSEKTMSPLIMKTCQQFIRDGFDVELWIPYRHNPEMKAADPFEYHGIEERFPIHVLKTPDLMPYLGNVGFLLMVLFFNVATAFRLRRYASREKVIVYAHDLRDLVVPSLLRLPMFCEIHDYYESGFRALNAFVLRRTNGLIVTNSIKQKNLHERYGYPMDRMIKQPNAVQVSMFDIEIEKDDARRQLDLPLDKKLVLYTGHLFSWKGVHTLAEAAQFLPDDTLIYFVGGTDHDRKNLQSFITERKLPRIKFLPHQPHGKIPVFLKAADVVVLPNTAKEDASKYETSPVKLFEYLASGQSLVVSDLPSIREVVSESEVTFAQPDDPQSFASTIGEVLHNRQPVEEKTKKARELAKTFSWESRGGAIAKLLKKFSEPGRAA